MMSRTYVFAASIGAISASGVAAQEVSNASFLFQGQEIAITQAQRPDAIAPARYFAPDEACAPLCIAPDVAAPGVATVSERAVIDFMAQNVATGDGLLIDSRLPADRALGFLPTSVSVPFSLVNDDNPYLPEILVAMGARSFEGALNFSDAMTLMVYDAGPASVDANQFIAAIIAAGYPASKIQYYRGGMQVWSTLGLTTQEAQS